MFITHSFWEIFQELTKCHAYHNALSHDSQAHIELWSSTKSIHSLSHLLLFSHSIVSDSLWPHGLQHARLPCPTPTPGAAQMHVYQVSDAIQPSHPLSSPSPAFNLSEHQDLFQWVSSLHQGAKILELRLQYQSFQSFTQWKFCTLFCSSVSVKTFLDSH